MEIFIDTRTWTTYSRRQLVYGKDASHVDPSASQSHPYDYGTPVARPVRKAKGSLRVFESRVEIAWLS
jgi:hypothetical protein